MKKGTANRGPSHWRYAYFDWAVVSAAAASGVDPADGVEEDEESVEEAVDENGDAVAEPFNAASVASSRLPEAVNPWAVWKSRNAASVFGPMTPSMVPGSCPLDFSDCCAC